MSIFLLVLGLFLIICLIIVHEFGHFIVAKRNGVKALEFGIFFPPAIWKKRTKNGLIFSINSVPLGGFVRLKGEHDADTGPGSFGDATLWQKTKIMLAGVFMNLLAAFVLLTVLAWLGMPKLVTNQFTIKSDTKISQDKTIVGSVVAGTPASSIGLRPSDQLLAIGLIGGKLTDINSANTLPNITKSFAGEKVELIYKRGQSIMKATTTLISPSVYAANEKAKNSKGYLGVAPVESVLQRSTWSAPVVAVGFMGQITALTFKGLATAVNALVHGHAKQASAQVAGPVGIYFLLKDVSTLGYQYVLWFVAVISLTLAIMNFLPIPALDGGRLFITAVSRIFVKRLKSGTEDLINGAGFAFLMLLIILITIVDVKRNF